MVHGQAVVLDLRRDVAGGDGAVEALVIPGYRGDGDLELGETLGDGFRRSMELGSAGDRCLASTPGDSALLTELLLGARVMENTKDERYYQTLIDNAR